jgi:exopolysaccharide biosynthesis polyprenyl glycosylphosphotransferase
MTSAAGREVYGASEAQRAQVDEFVEIPGRRQSIPRPAAVPSRRWTAALLSADIVAAVVAAGAGMAVRGSEHLRLGTTIPYELVAALLPAGWVGMMAAAGTYDRRWLAAGTEQYRRVVHAAAWLLAGIAMISYALHADLSRAFVIVTVPVALLLTIVGRSIVRDSLGRQLAGGKSIHRVLAIGTPHEIQDLAEHMHRAAFAGFRVVGALCPTGSVGLAASMPLVGTEVLRATEVALQVGADTVAVAGSNALPRGTLRELSWSMEGTDLDLLVVPAMTDVTGPRIQMRPVDGLPLLQIERPQFRGRRRLTKALMDRAGALFLLIVFMPVMVGIALSVRLSSRGPLFFRHRCIGLAGREFHVFKFRTMSYRADGDRDPLEHLRARNGAHFKAQTDPRITRVGGWLRRFSLDELPQLWNVLMGNMSLVGPRPANASEVALYGEHVGRRLLVKPGMTGLWQVSGRANLAWEDRVRLDLRYVESWSVGLDLYLLAKTLTCVVRGTGAY